MNVASKYEPTNEHERRLLRFAASMDHIPRKAIRCEIYGTVTAVVDASHARNIFRKVAPAAASQAIYAALSILQDRLDDN